MSTNWHTKKLEDIFSELGGSEAGLAKSDVAYQREKYGINALPEAKTDSLVITYLRQFQSPLIYMLLVAGIVMFLLDEAADAWIIFLLLIFNAFVGTIQEGKAQNTLKSLKRMVETKASVLRDHVEEIVTDTEVVTGDVLIFHEGDKVAADSRVINANNLTVDEAALTGESQPVYKSEEKLSVANLSPAEQKNMLFKGTNIVAGSGSAVVTSTGINTIIGKISQKIATIESEDPIKKEIQKLSKLIIIIAVSICASLFVIGIAAGNSAKEMFAIVVSLSVSVIPEGLPVVLTLVLATGVWRMSKNHVLVKKLQAVESLGQATVIAVDKTGTITKNELTVTKVFVDGKTFDVKGNGYEPIGNILLADERVGPEDAGLLRMARISAFCSNAYTAFSEEKQTWTVSGDPTEAALITFAEKLSLTRQKLEEENSRISEIPFSYLTKYHAVLNKAGSSAMLSVVGAPEGILQLCSSVWGEKQNMPISESSLQKLQDTVENFSAQGLRTLALATKVVNLSIVKPGDVRNLALVGFIGMKDVLRPESKLAINKANEAGIKVVMITGDHKLTAKSIAEEAGIYKTGSKIITGAEIENITTKDLAKILKEISVFARVTPEHKLQIIEAYKHSGEIIAMTGDGVNDAPPLVAADLGVAMGKIGTEVAKEAADIILLNDDFGNIITAVEEGRSIYKTIKKVILYLFSTSLGEVLVITGAIFLGFPIPLLATQIIWLNFVTDGFLDVSLGMEPKEPGLLLEKNRKSSGAFVDRLMASRIVLMSLTMGIGTVWLFSFYAHGDMTKAWTISLTTMAIFQWFNAWNCRSEIKSLLQMNFFANKFLLASTALVAFLQILAIYNPFLQRFLKTTALNWREWLIIILVSSSIIIVEEGRKLLARKFHLN